MTEHILPNYYPSQLKLEEDYYDDLSDIVNVLIALLTDYLEYDEFVSLNGLIAKYNLFYAQYYPQIMMLNNEMAMKIYNLAEETVPTNNFNQYNRLQLIVTDLNTKSTNLLQTVLGRFIALIPTGYTGIGNILFNENNTIDDLKQRNVNSVDKYVQTSITGGVAAALLLSAKINNYTEYLPDNMHDDRVRETHEKYNDGKTWYPLDKPAPCGYPGCPPGCRCKVKAFR